MGGEQDAAPELPEETGKKRKRRGGDQSANSKGAEGLGGTSHMASGAMAAKETEEILDCSCPS